MKPANSKMLRCKVMRHPLCPVLAALLLAFALEPCSRAEAQAAPVELRILAINDFHGYLQLHEFDEGKEELLRMQNGGGHPTDGCQGPHPFLGAKFRYLRQARSRNTGKTVFPPYAIREFEGIPVAFIGLTLKGTPNLVSPVGVAGLEFRDEADTVNALVPELKARGVEAIVVLIHEGGFPTGDYDECPGISGPIVDIVRKFDHAVDVVISGHTHQAYVCEIDGRLVTSGDKYGTIVSTIDLKLDSVTRDVISARADNVIVRTGAYAGDREQTG